MSLAQFDVHRNRGRARTQTPYFVIVQCNRFREHDHRLAVPLYDRSAFGPPSPIINPELTVEGRAVVLGTLDLASFPTPAFGERVCSLREHATEILTAIDEVLSGAG